MEKVHLKTIKFIDCKLQNKRIHIHLIENTKDNSKFFIIDTKTLQDFKKRSISTTRNSYSVETAKVLSDCLGHFFNNSEVVNKILLRELNDISEIKGSTNID